MPLGGFKLINMFHIFSKKESGYTIIETMIAVSIFLVVIMYGMGSLLNANVLHRKSQDMRSILDNLNFVVEDISRNLRTGHSYQCFSGAESLSPDTLSTPKSCASGWGLAFEASEGDPETYDDQWVYYISNDGKVFKSTTGANSFIQLTPDEVVVDAISSFAVLGAEPPSTNTQQPLVLIKLVGSITTREITTPFSLQTSISQRLLDI
jgi:Tfp pilus assembly protein PilW